jgi:hypothetical protein
MDNIVITKNDMFKHLRCNYTSKDQIQLLGYIWDSITSFVYSHLTSREDSNLALKKKRFRNFKTLADSQYYKVTHKQKIVEDATRVFLRELIKDTSKRDILEKNFSTDISITGYKYSDIINKVIRETIDNYITPKLISTSRQQTLLKRNKARESEFFYFLCVKNTILYLPSEDNLRPDKKTLYNKKRLKTLYYNHGKRVLHKKQSDDMETVLSELFKHILKGKSWFDDYFFTRYEERGYNPYFLVKLLINSHDQFGNNDFSSKYMSLEERKELVFDDFLSKKGLEEDELPAFKIINRHRLYEMINAVWNKYINGKIGIGQLTTDKLRTEYISKIVPIPTDIGIFFNNSPGLIYLRYYSDTHLELIFKDESSKKNSSLSKDSSVIDSKLEKTYQPKSTSAIEIKKERTVIVSGSGDGGNLRFLYPEYENNIRVGDKSFCRLIDYIHFNFYRDNSKDTIVSEYKNVSNTDNIYREYFNRGKTRKFETNVKSLIHEKLKKLYEHAIDLRLKSDYNFRYTLFKLRDRRIRYIFDGVDIGNIYTSRRDVISNFFRESETLVIAPLQNQVISIITRNYVTNFWMRDIILFAAINNEKSISLQGINKVYKNLYGIKKIDAAKPSLQLEYKNLFRTTFVKKKKELLGANHPLSFPAVEEDILWENTCNFMMIFSQIENGEDIISEAAKIINIKYPDFKKKPAREDVEDIYIKILKIIPSKKYLSRRPQISIDYALSLFVKNKDTINLQDIDDSKQPSIRHKLPNNLKEFSGIITKHITYIFSKFSDPFTRFKLKLFNGG